MKTSHLIILSVLSGFVSFVILMKYRPLSMAIILRSSLRYPRPFGIPIMWGRIDKVRQLIKEGYDVNIKGKDIGMTPLHIAVRIPTLDLEIITFLLKHGADVNAKDRYGGQPLHDLVRAWRSEENTKTSIQVISLLLKHGADVNAKNNRGNTALGGSNLRNLEIITFLLKHGADANAKNDRGSTALHRSDHMSLEIISLLLKHGADINVKDKQEETPLYSLISGASGCSTLFQKVKLLIRFGANSKISNNEGKTPLFQARIDQSKGLKSKKHGKCWREAYSKIVPFLENI